VAPSHSLNMEQLGKRPKGKGNKGNRIRLSQANVNSLSEDNGKQAGDSISTMMRMKATKSDRDSILSQHDRIQAAIDNLQDELVKLEHIKMDIEHKYRKN
jgi:hypothetical protein